MKYSQDYLEREFGIFYDEKYDLYDMPMLWANSDDTEEFMFTIGEAVEMFEDMMPKINNLSKLPVENGDTIIVALTNYIEYLAEFQVWDCEDHKTDVFITYNKFDIDNFDRFEEVAELVATWFYMKGYKDITIEVRKWETEEYVEGFVDYIESK